MIKLSNRQVYDKVKNLYDQVNQGNIPLNAALNRITHILAGSDNDNAINYLMNWESFVTIFPKDHFIKHYEKTIPTEQQDEYKFEVKLGVPKAEAEDNAEKILVRDVKELKHIKTLPNTLLQPDGKGHIEIANAKGLKMLVRDLSLDAHKGSSK